MPAPLNRLAPDSIRILALTELRQILGSPVHTLRNLFAQLGLPSDEAGIVRFIDTHGPLPESTLMPDARFWTSSQAAFLREEALGDADWAAVIDALNVALHGSH